MAILVVLVVQFAFSVKIEERIVKNTADDAALELAARGAQHVALALFITRSSDEMDDLEEILAQISRTVVDYFLLVPSGPLTGQ